MIISITSPAETRRNGFHEVVHDRMTRTLERFAHRIASVNVTLTNENGPRGGVDKLCRVTVVMPGRGQLTTTARHKNPLAAVRMAADRVRRMVLTKLKRPQALRVRRRKSVAAPLNSHSDEALQI